MAVPEYNEIKAPALCRRVFERRFAGLVGRPPKAMVLRLRLERVKELLADTALALAQIADRTGSNTANTCTRCSAKKPEPRPENSANGRNWRRQFLILSAPTQKSGGTRRPEKILQFWSHPVQTQVHWQ